MGLATFLKFAQRVDANWHRRRHPESRAVLVDSRTPMNYAIVAPIHRAMREDHRVTFYFTSSEAPRRNRENHREAEAEARLLTPAQAALLKFDACLTADQLWVKLPRGSRRIQMFHGVAGKYGHVYDAPQSSMRHWHRLFFINRRRLQNYVAGGALDADAKAACLIGMPKLDCLVDGSLRRDAVLAALGLDPARPTVLYAPTWSPYSSVNAYGVELVERLCRAGYTVMVKLHDRSRDKELVHSGGVDWGARLLPILERYGGHLARGGDACPYLAAADVLISDHSSVGFEYLLLDRPVVRIEMPELIARTNIHEDYVRMMAEVSLSVKDATQAVAAVERSLADTRAKAAERRRVAEELFYLPGTATRRAVQELYEVIELNPVNTAGAL